MKTSDIAKSEVSVAYLIRSCSCANSSFGLRQAPAFADNVQFIKKSSLMSYYNRAGTRSDLFGGRFVAICK